jgi:S-adenosylmethionine:tRNA ribosyltransferase-isomerase
MKVRDFDYRLPRELIAQEPLPRRDASRLLVSHPDGRLEHRAFPDVVEYLRDETVYLNDTRVIPARLLLRRETGGKVEALLVRRLEGLRWHALLDTSRRLRTGESLKVDDRSRALIAAKEGDRWVLEFDREPDLARLGRPPLPPYIRRPADDRDLERYQTVYAARDGSIAAPTAGLHFTPGILAGLRTKAVTLHVGVGTFKPVNVEDVEAHRMEAEYFEIPDPPSGRVAVVGTTACRALETWALTGKTSGWTDLFIHPPFEFRAVRTLVTNFHLPRSTLLMLVCALAGRERILAAYEEAVRERYRFFSYGDAMLIRTEP